jgi:hypothetical protein
VRLSLAGFKKWLALCCPLFFPQENCSSATYLPDFKTGETSSCRFAKLSVPFQEICHPIRAKDLNSLVLISSQQIQIFSHFSAYNFNSI